LPIFARRAEKLLSEGIADNSMNILLKTIRVPKNKQSQSLNYFLTYLSDKLPKPNYEEILKDEEKSGKKFK
jgi:hypothetical protein